MGTSQIPRFVLIGSALKLPVALLFSFWCLWAAPSVAQKVVSSNTDTLTRPDYRLLHGMFAAQTLLYGTSLYALSKAWYQNPLTQFKFSNDSREWLQMDKAGHVYTAYHISRLTSRLYSKTGISKTQAAVYGAISGMMFQTPIEILDGFSPDYGFSWADIGANALGSGLFAAQQLIWDQERILPKYSFHRTSLAPMRPGLLGSGAGQEWLKDYNGQTYWLSASPGSFLHNRAWPRWLCISIGYGIQNALSAERNQSIQYGFEPYRQIYVSLDVDLTQIPTRKKWVRTVAFLFNAIKFPAPAFEFNNKGVAFRPLYF